MAEQKTDAGEIDLRGEGGDDSPHRAGPKPARRGSMLAVLEGLPPALKAGAALVTAIAGLVAALAAAGVIGGDSGADTPPPSPTAVATVDLSMEISGPLAMPLYEVVYFEIDSTGAERIEWNVPGFDDTLRLIRPAGPSNRIWLQTSETSVVGQQYDIVATAYAADGGEVESRYRFEIVNS